MASGDRYFNTIVQICKPDGSAVGAGIIVDSHTLITCAHVVAAALGLREDAPESLIPDKATVGIRRNNVDGANTAPLPGRVTRYFARERGSRFADISVVELNGVQFDLNDHPIAPFEISTDPINSEISIFGFPVDARETIDQTIPAIYRLVENMPNSWFSATAAQVQGQEIRRGFSGAPVMRRASRLLFGMVCEADPSRRTATIIPAEVLKAVHPISIEEVRGDSRSQSARRIEISAVSGGALRSLFDFAFPKLHYALTVRFGILADPPERAILEDYISENKAIFVDQIASKTFLPGPAKEIGETPVQLSLARTVFFSPVQQLIREIAGVSSGGDSASAQISALSKQSRRVRNLIDLLLTSGEPLIVLGDPGSGKSITLKQAAIVLSDVNRQRVFPSICIFVPLGSWRPSDQPTIHDVEQLVESSLPDSIRPLLPALKNRRRVVVIFDGMDEMSRESYTQKTEALSRYAEKYSEKIHSLFSCRIADYSPAFRHRRLVLLPFGQAQIKQFLIRQFGKVSLEVSGKFFPVAEVAKYLATEDLPIEPQNPFSLWLITLYLRERKEWPYTRVALLKFLYDYTFERKRQEALNRREGFPDKPVMLAAWGQLARSITVRNRGSDIGVHEVRQMFGPAAGQIMSVGRACGVLQQSIEHDPPLLRFEHQRAQEYFTALDIAATNEQIDWETLWDVPRWQETLVNLSQMDGERTPLVPLSKSLMYISSDDGLRTRLGPGRAGLEALAAERVEFASRVLRSIAPSPGRDELQKQISIAATWLGKNGNPTSVVRVLRIAQEIPQLGLWDTVQTAMAHPVNWVREQAQIVGVTLAADRASSPLPESIASAFADGSILASQAHYLRMAKRLKSPAVAFVASVAALIFLLQAIVSGFIAPLTTKALVTHVHWGRLAPDIQHKELVVQFFDHWLLRIVVAVSIATTMVSVAVRPKFTWLVTPLSGFGAALLSPLIYCGWLWAFKLSLFSVASGLVSTVGILMFAAPIGSLAMFAIGSLLWLVFSTFCAALLAYWTKDRRLFSITYRVTWKRGDYTELLDFAKENGGDRLLFGLFGIPFALVIFLDRKTDFAHRLHKYLIAFPTAPDLLDVWLTVCLIVLGLTCLFWLAIFISRAGPNRKLPNRGPILWAFIAFVGSYGVFLFAKVEVYLGDRAVSWLQSLLGRFSAGWLIYVAIGLVLLGALGSLCYIVGILVRPVWRWMRMRIVTIGELRMSAATFRSDIARFTPDQQAMLLNIASPRLLSMDATAFNTFLIELEIFIKKEPALGRYWAKRAEIQDLVRQERTS